jgi:hypothetical protein
MAGEGAGGRTYSVCTGARRERGGVRTWNYGTSDSLLSFPPEHFTGQVWALQVTTSSAAQELLIKLVLTKPDKKFTGFLKHLRFIIVFTVARHWTCLERVQPLAPHFLNEKLLPTHPCLVFQSSLFSPDFYTEKLCTKSKAVPLHAMEALGGEV